MIRNVIFDIGNVLAGYDWHEYIDSFQFPPEKAASIAHALFAGPLWNELDRGLIPIAQLEDMFAELAPQYGEDVRRVFRTAGRCISRRSWAIPWIRELKSRGLHVYYLSNYSEFILEQTRPALDFLPFMDGGLFSCEVKQTKPEPEIFRSLMERYPSIRPEESVFFDDTSANTESACRLGFHGIVFKDRAQAEAELERLLSAEHPA